MSKELFAFGRHDAQGVWRPHDFGDRYFVETVQGVRRLVVGPRRSCLDLALLLADEMPPSEWGFLYLLVVTRSDQVPEGRYETCFADLETLKSFTADYADLLTNDGRHHYWLNCYAGSSAIICDRHNRVFAYGDVDTLERKVISLGMREEAFQIDFEHAHHYHEEYDKQFGKLMTACGWRYSPLKPGDED
ncbi:MAG: hypothetical protein AAFV43_08255 [Planctomycetota bacterium]